MVNNKEIWAELTSKIYSHFANGNYVKGGLYRVLPKEGREEKQSPITILGELGQIQTLVWKCFARRHQMWLYLIQYTRTRVAP